MAMLSPIVPLILVCVCGVMEMAKPGSGNGFGRMIYLEPQQLSFKRMFPALQRFGIIRLKPFKTGCLEFLLHFDLLYY